MDDHKLNKYLEVVSSNKRETETAERSVFLKGLNDEFTFRTLTRKEVREITFSLPYNTKCFQDIYNNKVFRKTIYNCCGLAPLATKAKEQGLINTYYDIIDYLFSSDDIVTLWLAIMEENKIGESLEKDDDLKN